MMMMMRAMSFCFLVFFLQVLSLVRVSTRQLDLQTGFALYNQDTGIVNFKSQQVSNEGMKKKMLVEDPGANKEMNKIGSRPPSCEHKCYGCMPCEATQVPTTPGRVAVQYTNYEPEGWKCKCGLNLYTS